MRNEGNMLASLIEQTFGESTKDLGEFGSNLLKSARETLQKEKDNSEDVSELSIKLSKYRNCELSGDLLQIPYSTWNALGLYPQVAIRIGLEPLMWGAVYVSLSEMIANEKEFFAELLPSSSLNVIKKGSIFVLESSTANPGFYESYKPTKICEYPIHRMYKRHPDTNELIVQTFEVPDGK